MIRYPLIKPNLGKEELAEIRRVFASGWLTQGPIVEKFEREVARYVGAKHAVAVTSCTIALYLGLRALGLKGRVVVPDFTFPATANAAIEAGLTPILCEVSADDCGIDTDMVEKHLGNEVSGIIVVHPFGYPLDIDRLVRKAAENNVVVMEDAATALGSIRGSKYAGNMANIGCYSLHPRKLVTTGEGGVIVLNDSMVYEKLIQLRNHGIDKQGKFRVNSLNFRFPDILAAVGLVQLRKLEKVIARRRKLADAYTGLIKDNIQFIKPPKSDNNARCSYQSYVVFLAEGIMNHQQKIISLMKTKYGVETQIGTYALHFEPAFERFPRIGSLDVSERLMKSSLTLPMYEELEYKDLEYIVNCLRNVIKSLTL